MKTLSICYIGLLTCLTKCALSAVVTPQSAINSSVAIGSEDGPNINESYILNTTEPNGSNLTVSAGPVWIYPQGKNLALKFDNFGLVTTGQTLNAFAVLATVLEAARGYIDYEGVHEAQTYRWGNGAPMVASFSPDPSRRLVWGDIIDTAIAMQNFLATIPCTCWVEVHVNNPAKSNLGVFLLGVSTSTVSSS